MPAPSIRPLALCIFHHQGRILVNEFEDAATGQRFFRPVGGGIEFGERSHEAVVREVQEELGLAISEVRLVGTLESIFTYAGKPGHEIVQVYDARFDDAAVYEQPWLQGHESDGASFQASWHSGRHFGGSARLVPEGLFALLKQHSLLDD